MQKSSGGWGIISNKLIKSESFKLDTDGGGGEKDVVFLHKKKKKSAGRGWGLVLTWAPVGVKERKRRNGLAIHTLGRQKSCGKDSEVVLETRELKATYQGF